MKIVGPGHVRLTLAEAAVVDLYLDEYPDPVSERLRREVQRMLAAEQRTDADRDRLRGLAVPPSGGDEISERCAEIALTALVAGWPDEHTRELVLTQASADDPYLSRADGTLAAIWPDERSRDELVRLVRGGKLFGSLTVDVLLEAWPDDPVCRDLVADLAADDPVGVWEQAVRLFGPGWPDERHRALFEAAVRDRPDEPDAGVAIRYLTAHWPDDDTVRLLAPLLAEDPDQWIRHAIVRGLAEHRPDDTTRDLLVRHGLAKHRAGKVADREGHRPNMPRSGVRTATVYQLAERWPDTATRELLHELVATDADGHVRGAALRSLAGPAQGSRPPPDGTIRALLTSHVVEDAHWQTRQGAAEELLEHWPDEDTRAVLTTLAVEDPEGDNRGFALDKLARHFPDERTAALLTERLTAEVGFPYARQWAALGLVRLGPEERARSVLVDIARHDESPGVRRNAVHELRTRWPGQETRDVLRRLRRATGERFRRHVRHELAMLEVDLEFGPAVRWDLSGLPQIRAGTGEGHAATLAQ